MDDPGTRIDPMGVAGDELRADAVMPAQFYPPRRGSAESEPIVRLMGGVLADAVRCVQRNLGANSSTRRQEFREARLWIFDNQGEGPFSYVDVCDTLGIDPHRLREWIVRWEKDRHPGERPRMIRRSAVLIGGRVPSRRSKG